MPTTTKEYPNGVCLFCGKEFERPHKYKTETEGLHIRECQINEIEKLLESDELDLATKLMYQDEIKDISHSASFGAKKDNANWKIMIKCKNLIKKHFGDEK